MQSVTRARQDLHNSTAAVDLGAFPGPHRRAVVPIVSRGSALRCPLWISAGYADLVDRIARDPALTRVDSVAAVFGTGVRRLQRRFADYAGVGPKWVIRRYRLHEVAERLGSGQPVDWAGLAAELGYADQAHLVRDFPGHRRVTHVVRAAVRAQGDGVAGRTIVDGTNGQWRARRLGAVEC